LEPKVKRVLGRSDSVERSDGAFVYFFGPAGMDPPVAFSLGLLVFGLSLVLWVVGAVLYWRDRP